MQNDTLENGKGAPEKPSDKAPELTDSKAAVPAEGQDTSQADLKEGQEVAASQDAVSAEGQKASQAAMTQDQKVTGSTDAVAQAKEKAKEGLDKAKDWADNNEAIAKAKGKGKEGLHKAEEGLHKAKDWADNNEAIAKAKEKGKEGLHKAEEGLHKAKDWADNNEAIGKVKTKVKETFQAFDAWTDSKPKVSQAKQQAKAALKRANSWLLAKHIGTKTQIVIGVVAVYIVLQILSGLFSLVFSRSHEYEPKITPSSLFAYTKEKDDTLGEYAYIQGIIRKKGHALITYDVLEFPSELDGLPVKKITTPKDYGGFTKINDHNQLDLYVDEELTKEPVECYGNLDNANSIVIPEGVESFEGHIRNTYLERFELPSTLKEFNVRDSALVIETNGKDGIKLSDEEKKKIENIGLDLSSEFLKEIVVKCKVRHIKVGSPALEKLVLPEDLSELVIKTKGNAMLENDFKLPEHLKSLTLDGKVEGIKFPESLESVSLSNSPKELTLPSNKALNYVNAPIEILNLPNLEHVNLSNLPSSLKKLNCPVVKDFTLGKTTFKSSEYAHYIIGDDGRGHKDLRAETDIPEFLKLITINDENMARIYMKKTEK